MKRAGSKKQTPAFERMPRPGQYLLRLYVSGATPRSLQAIEKIKDLCETHLKGRYRLAVVDMYQQPELVKREQILAAPTLIKQLPLPIRRFIGDMTKTERLLSGLDVQIMKQTR